MWSAGLGGDLAQEPDQIVEEHVPRVRAGGVVVGVRALPAHQRQVARRNAGLRGELPGGVGDQAPADRAEGIHQQALREVMAERRLQPEDRARRVGVALVDRPGPEALRREAIGEVPLDPIRVLQIRSASIAAHRLAGVSAPLPFQP